MNSLRKSVSIVMVTCFFGTSTGLPEASHALARPILSSPFIIPKEFGQISATYAPLGQSPRIVLIQDFHAHYQTQKNIAEILNVLAGKREKTLPFALAMEGASGPVDTSVLGLFPNRAIREVAADYLMHEGELTGAEYFAAMRGITQGLVGVEEAAAYTLHRELFRKTYTDRERLVRLLEGLQVSIARLRHQTYTGSLKAFQKKWEALENGEMSLPEAIEWLDQTAKPLGLDVDSLKNLQANDAVYDRLSILAYQLKSQLATTLQEKDLVQVDHDLTLLVRVSQLQATEQEVRSFAPRMNQFVEFARAMVKNTSSREWRNLISSSIDYYALAMARNEPMVENTLKLIAGPATQPAGSSHGAPPMAVLVAGGFHTAPITHLLKDQQIPYVVITPEMGEVSESDHPLYVKRLRGDHLTVPQVMAAAPRLNAAVQMASKNSTNHKSDTLAVGIAATAGVLYLSSLVSATGLSLDQFTRTFLDYANDPHIASIALQLKVLVGGAALGMAWRGPHLSDTGRRKVDPNNPADYDTMGSVPPVRQEEYASREQRVNISPLGRRFHVIFPNEQAVKQLSEAALVLKLARSTDAYQPKRRFMFEGSEIKLEDPTQPKPLKPEDQAIDAIKDAAAKLHLSRSFVEELLKDIPGLVKLTGETTFKGAVDAFIENALREAAARTIFIEELRLLRLAGSQSETFSVPASYAAGLEQTVKESGQKIGLTPEQIDRFIAAGYRSDKDIAAAMLEAGLELKVLPESVRQIKEQLSILKPSSGSGLVPMIGWLLLGLGAAWWAAHFGGEAIAFAIMVPFARLESPSLQLKILDLYRRNNDEISRVAQEKGLRNPVPEGEVNRNINHVLRVVEMVKFVKQVWNPQPHQKDPISDKQLNHMVLAALYHDLGKWNSADFELLEVLYAPRIYDRDSEEMKYVRQVLERHEEYADDLAKDGGVDVPPPVYQLLEYMRSGKLLPGADRHVALMGGIVLACDIFDAMTDVGRHYQNQVIRSDTRVIPEMMGAELLRKMNQEDPYGLVPFMVRLYKTPAFQILVEESIMQQAEAYYAEGAAALIPYASNPNSTDVLVGLRNHAVEAYHLYLSMRSPALWPESLQFKNVRFDFLNPTTLHSLFVSAALIVNTTALPELHQLILNLLIFVGGLATFFSSSSPDTAKQPRPAKRLTVVLVEDDDGFRQMAKSMLEDDFQVVVFSNGYDAWDYLQSHEADVLVTDLEMPIMDGKELIDNVKTAGHSMPIFLLTSHTGALRQQVKEKYPEVYVLEKPDPLVLGDVIQQKLKKIDGRGGAAARPVAHNDVKNLVRARRYNQALQGMVGILINALLWPLIKNHLRNEFSDMAKQANGLLAAAGLGEVTFKELGGSLWRRLTVFGDFEGKTVSVNLLLTGDPKLRTFIHEALHVLNLKMSEVQVIEMTDELLRRHREAERALPAQISLGARVLQRARLKVNPADFLSILPQMIHALPLKPKQSKDLSTRVQRARLYLIQA